MNYFEPTDRLLPNIDRCHQTYLQLQELYMSSELSNEKLHELANDAIRINVAYEEAFAAYRKQFLIEISEKRLAESKAQLVTDKS